MQPRLNQEGQLHFRATCFFSSPSKPHTEICVPPWSEFSRSGRCGGSTRSSAPVWTSGKLSTRWPLLRLAARREKRVRARSRSQEPIPRCPVVPLFPFFWGNGSPFKSTNQERMHFLPMATGHLSIAMYGSMLVVGSRPGGEIQICLKGVRSNIVLVRHMVAIQV